MAIGERFRSGGARGIARFLADHQHCDAGFDVRRDESGSGRLRITCLGCGETVDYRAAEAGELAAGMATGFGGNGEPQRAEEVAAAPLPVPPPQAPSSQGPAPPPRVSSTGLPGVRRSGSAPSARRFGVPGWIPLAVIGVLIVGGLAMIAIGLLREDGGDEPAPSAPESAQEQTQPGAGAQPQEEPSDPQGSAGSPGAEDAVPLRRRRFADRFTIGVPPGWDRGVEGRAIKITAPGATAELNVFFESGARPAPQLARAARDFLAQRHDAGQLQRPQPVRIASRRGLRVRITYQGGEEVAVVLAAKGVSYLVLRRVDRGASDDIARQAEAALASFRPG